MDDLCHELKHCQPFASASQDAIVSLVRTGDQLAQFFRQRDLTFSQCNLLRSLDWEDRRLTCGEVGDHC